MLRIKNLTAAYGKIKALHGVSLHVQEREIVALIGANGAGKTTLLNAVSGVAPPREGSVLFRDEEIGGKRPDQIVRRGVCQVPEGRQIFSRQTVRENLELGAYLRFKGEGRREVAKDVARMFARFPVLKDRERQIAGTLSGGEQQMLAIARGLMSRPRIMLLDEPSMGLAPRLVSEIFTIIVSLRAEGVTILLVEQNARAALSIADRAYVLEVGRVVLQGEAAKLVQDPEVKRAYLGRDYGEIWEK
jgi:branched-chain amino acid transport system ATP-binding protein